MELVMINKRERLLVLLGPRFKTTIRNNCRVSMLTIRLMLQSLLIRNNKSLSLSPINRSTLRLKMGLFNQGQSFTDRSQTHLLSNLSQ